MCRTFKQVEVSMSIKVAMIGAGSVVFSKNLTGDILGYPEFKDANFTYMDIDEERLEVGANLCRKVAKTLDANPTVEATTDRREALKGADFVINMVQIGGFNSTLVDFEIPRKYGLNFTIADTTGPGGLFRALRTYPMIVDLVHDMEELCPNAVLLNYSNPMSMNMLTISRNSGIEAVGLCHSVQGTFGQLMGYLGEKPDEATFVCAGINHMAFYLEMKKNGVDLYPRLFEAMNDPKVYGSNKVRFELMKVLGYFITESSEHNAEYCSYFIPHGQEVVEKYNVPLDEYLRRCDRNIDQYEKLIELSKNDEPMKIGRSHEYGSLIMHSICTNTPRVVYGNMPNKGAISNLPDDAIVEVPTLVDGSGLKLTTVGDLPPQLIGYMQPHITQQELFIRAAMEGRRDHVYQAAMYDPLTAATLTLDKIVEMCDELIEAHAEFLPPLDAKATRVPTSGKTFSPPTAQELRESWDNAQREKTANYIKEAYLLSPITSSEEGKTTLQASTSVEEAMLASGDGSVDLTQTYGEAAWKLRTENMGFFNLNTMVSEAEDTVVYAYLELDSIHPREAEMDALVYDGVRVWLNGEEILNTEGAVRYSLVHNVKTVSLNDGTNRFLVKLDHASGRRCGFTLDVSEPNF
jgi:alpha-galactosidase